MYRSLKLCLIHDIIVSLLATAVWHWQLVVVGFLLSDNYCHFLLLTHFWIVVIGLLLLYCCCCVNVSELLLSYCYCWLIIFGLTSSAYCCQLIVVNLSFWCSSLHCFHCFVVVGYWCLMCFVDFVCSLFFFKTMGGGNLTFFSECHRFRMLFCSKKWNT